MPPLHIPILIVLLLIPNTTWRDWHAARGARRATALQNQITGLMNEPGSSCAVAVMNDRTAETDKITALAGDQTLLAGARLKSSLRQPTAATSLGYAALEGNLPQSLARRGVAPEAGDPESLPLIAGVSIGSSTRGKFVVATLPANSRESISRIEAWRDKVTRAGKGGELILVSPNPSPAEYRIHDQLTPILFWHSDGGTVRPELLYSPSTRTLGLIANTDVAATIAASAGIQLIGPSFGSICTTQEPPSTDNGAEVLTAISRNSALQARHQQSVPFLAAVLAVLIAVASGLAWSKKFAQAGYAAVCVIATIPLTLLYARTWQEALVATIIVTVAGAAFAVATRGLSFLPITSAVSGLLKHWLVPIYAIASLGLIASDTLFNHAHGTASSLLGYSPLEGARYYGLGNEAMGVLAGTAAVLSSRIALSIKAGGATSRQGVIAGGAILWIAIAALLALPYLGAKAGAIPVSAIGLISYLAVVKKTPSWVSSTAANRFKEYPGLAWAVLTAGAVAFALLACNKIMHSHSAETHVAVSIEQARRFGPSIYSQIALRKLKMDAHLVIHSVWMLVLTAAVAGTALNQRKSRRANGGRVKVGAGIIIGAMTTLSCLLFNDAGVVAAALCSCFVWSDALLAQAHSPTL